MFTFVPRSFRNAVAAAGLVVLVFGVALGTPAATNTNKQAPAPNSADYNLWLTNQVRHELVMLPFYSVFDNLQYTVQGNKVTLLGQVVRPNMKDDAARAVKHIEGVESVDNQIQVLPTSFNDDHIRRSEFRAIYSFPTLQMYSLRNVPPIHIIVSNGHVTLEGSVARQADKDAANIVANSVSGVFSVTNNLRVDKS
jgi:hyperosmotically inducible periplasmic protein